MGTRRQFSREFKLEAVRMVLEDDRTQAEVARKLDIPPSALCNWITAAQAHGDEAFPGMGRLKGKDAEIRRLQLEVERLRKEKDFLKKAIRFFGKGWVGLSTSSLICRFAAGPVMRPADWLPSPSASRMWLLWTFRSKTAAVWI